MIVMRCNVKNKLAGTKYKATLIASEKYGLERASWAVNNIAMSRKFFHKHYEILSTVSMGKADLGTTKPSIEDAERDGIDIGMIGILSAHVSLYFTAYGLDDWGEIMSALLTTWADKGLTC